MRTLVKLVGFGHLTNDFYRSSMDQKEEQTILPFVLEEKSTWVTAVSETFAI